MSDIHTLLTPSGGDRSRIQPRLGFISSFTGKGCLTRYVTLRAFSETFGSNAVKRSGVGIAGRHFGIKAAKKPSPAADPSC